MKTLRFTLVLVLLFSMAFFAKATDIRAERLNLPGDNLNLYAVMKLFQESETLEAFERGLNDEESRINNLDLNGDNYIDYIKVIDYVDGNNHTIVLQVAINERETQDVAVITVFKDRAGNITVQMIGDEDLYGKNYVIEPYYAETPNPGYIGNRQPVTTERVVTKTVYVEVRTWPVVRYIYAPTYVVYRSPWYWGYYPRHWRPWRAYYWDYYYGYHYHWYDHYYACYRPVRVYNYATYYNNYYYNNYRTYSVTVHNYRANGRYDYTYTRPDLRSEGIAEYQHRVGNAGRTTETGRATNPGRNAQVGADNPGRGTAPVANPGRGSSSGTGRVSSDVNGRKATEVKTDRTVPSTGRTTAPVVIQERKTAPW